MKFFKRKKRKKRKKKKVMKSFRKHLDKVFLNLNIPLSKINKMTKEIGKTNIFMLFPNRNPLIAVNKNQKKFIILIFKDWF